MILLRLEQKFGSRLEKNSALKKLRRGSANCLALLHPLVCDIRDRENITQVVEPSARTLVKLMCW